MTSSSKKMMYCIKNIVQNRDISEGDGMGFTVGLVSPPLLSFTRISFLNQTFSMQFFLWIGKGTIRLLINSLIFDSFIPYIITASHFKNLTIAEKIFTSALGFTAND